MSDHLGMQGTTRQDAPGERSRRSRVLRRVVGSLLVLVLLVAAGLAVYAAYLDRTINNNVTYADLLPSSSPGAAAAPQRKPAAKNAMNLLLIGSDSRTAQASQGRSDVIILAHISDDRQRIDLIHFPRDMYVNIPGQGQDKINAAFAYGGAPSLVQTLQQLVDVPVDHVAIIDFEGFKAMTDAVGGVDVQVTEASPGFRVGTMHMSGEQGLAFVRERHALGQGDIGRGQRQEAFIKAVLLKGLSKDVLLNPATLSSYLTAATTNMTIDRGFTTGAMRSLALSLRDIRGGNIHTLTAPWSGVGTSPAGASIVKVDYEQMAVLSEALQKDLLTTYQDTTSPTTGFSR